MIDTYGFRTAVGIGAMLTGVFGLTRGLAADRYTAVLAAQIGIAIGQPFVLNAVTKVAARWFPLEERATASGFGSLAMYLGILAGMLRTPFVTLRVGPESMLLIYGAGAAVAAVVFVVLAREQPPTPEGTSNGLLLLMGQISGIAFIFAMDHFKVASTGSMTPSLLGLMALMLLAVAAGARLRESGLLASAAG